jgi:hypothetical protein
LLPVAELFEIVTENVLINIVKHEQWKCNKIQIKGHLILKVFGKSSRLSSRLEIGVTVYWNVYGCFYSNGD